MNAIIAKGYQLFNGYRATLPLDICTDCCMPPEDAALLAAKPVSDIPLDLLMQYNDGAATDKTPIEEIKHFLPRYADLIWNFEFPTHSEELSLKRLSPFDNSEWEKEELEWLNTFKKSFFTKCINTYPLPHGLDLISVLILFNRAHLKTESLLQIWKADEGLSSCLHFKDLFMEGFKIKSTTSLTNSFASAELEHSVKIWMDSVPTKEHFKNGIEKLIMDNKVESVSELNQLNLFYEML